ncbi:MAG: hypothetical protein R2744_13445 [Bacteroidales bacterium]
MKKYLLFAIALIASVTLMGQSDEERGHSPGSGLFLSMSIGPSYMSINDDITGGTYDNITFKGYGMGLDFQLGAVFRENLIFHGDLVAVPSSSLKMTVDGEEAGTLEDENEIGMMMYGGGLTYYIMPQNIFLSGAIGAGQYTITTAGEEGGSTQTGIGLFLKVGKEWFVSKNWDLGFNFSFKYVYVNNEVETMAEKLSGISAGIGFNATFN